MSPEQIALLAFMAVTDRFFKETCPPEIDEKEWRDGVMACGDEKELWLKSILGIKE